MDSDLFKNRNLADDEETIAKTINYLKLNDPENATRDYAVGFLGYMQRVAYGVEKRQDLNMDDFLAEFKKSHTDSLG